MEAEGQRTEDTVKKKQKASKRKLTKSERDKLFNKYVRPHLVEIKAMAVRYTNKFDDWEDNYIYTLQLLYSYIHTYNVEKSLITWLHIVTKRACFYQNTKKARRKDISSDIYMIPKEESYESRFIGTIEDNFGNLSDHISDEVYSALIKIEPRRLSAFLLFVQGNNIRDITNIEYMAGHLEQKNEAVIRSRIYWARRQLRYILEQNGITTASYTSEKRHQSCYNNIDG